MAEFMAVEVGGLIGRGLDTITSPARRFQVEEVPSVFLEASGDAYSAGVLGIALIGKFGDPAAALQRWLALMEQSPDRELEAAAQLLGIPAVLARLIDLNHRNGMGASEIAGRLTIGALGLISRRQVLRVGAAR